MAKTEELDINATPDSVVTRPGKPRLVIEKERLSTLQANLARLGFLAAILLFWQYVPEFKAVQHAVPALNPFFISSPVGTAKTLWALFTGHGDPSVWPYVKYTLEATIFGFLIGIVSGGLVGLLLSNDIRLRQVFNPFINALNAAPKIALIPVILIIFGPSQRSSIVTSALIVFFTVFFNAYAGGRSVPQEMLESARLMGASPIALMYRIRMRYVMVWTFAALPNAVTYALLGVVTAEVLGGALGLGQLIVQAIAEINANLTFAVVVLLSVIGAVLVGAADLLRKRILHWWPGGGA